MAGGVGPGLQAFLCRSGVGADVNVVAFAVKS